MPVNEDVECARPAQANAGGNLQFAFDAFFQAHGPGVDVTSKEAAFDFHSHSSTLADITTQTIVSIHRNAVELFCGRLGCQKLLFLRIESLPASNHSGPETE
jgi:hypothetical protein